MDYELLSRSPLFRGLNPEETERTLRTVNFRIRSFRPGSVIALGGEVVNSLQIVACGLVKGEMVDQTGRILKIEDIPAPRLLAPAFLFGAANRYPVNVTAVDNVTLIVIEKSDFISLLRGSEIILTNYLDTISSRSQFLSERIRFITFRTIKGKMANYILERTSPDKPLMRLTLTQQELSDFFGVARPSLARVIRELEDEKLILASGRDISVISRKGLLEITG